MTRNLSELANLINEEFTKQGDREVLTGLRRQIISNDPEDNETAYKTITGRGVDITKDEFALVRDYTVFEARKTAKYMKNFAFIYIFIGIAIAVMSIFLRNRITVFGLIAAALLLYVGISSYKKAKRIY